MRTKNEEKQNPIAEMAKTVCHLDRTCDECMTSFECKAMMYAKRFYNAGYRKIPEGAIILTKEEIAALNEYQKKHCTGGEPVEG